MRKFLTLTVLSTIAMTSFAAEDNDSIPNIARTLTGTERIFIEQPQGLLKRIEYNPNEETEDKGAGNATNTRSGFRVEVFADNNVRTAKSRAASKRTQLVSKLPQYKVYVVFEAPFWRVQLGDFATRAAANAALADVRKAYPRMSGDLRIVRCNINR